MDTTIYTNWNALLISAYLEAAQVLQGEEGFGCRVFALGSLDRLIAEGWDDRRGFSHRLGSRDDHCNPIALTPIGSEKFVSTERSTIRSLRRSALLDGFEATLNPRYFVMAESTLRLVIDNYADNENGGFFDRASDASIRSAASTCAGSRFRTHPLQPATPWPLSLSTGSTDSPETTSIASRQQIALEAFSGVAQRFGMFAATYGLATLIHARHPVQMVVTGASSDNIASKLEQTAQGFYRFGKAVLRVTPETNLEALPHALRETLPGLRPETAQAFVCTAGTCFPPVSDPQKLTELLARVGTGSGAAAV